MKKAEQLSEKQQKLIGGLAIGVFVLAMLLMTWLIGAPLLRFAGEPEHIRAWVERSGLGGRLAYMGLVIIQIIVALIPGEALEIAGGYAFGAFEGTLLCMAAATLGSLLVFAMVRRFGVRLVEIFFTAEKLRSLRFLRTTRKREMLFLIIFMIPGTPKDLLCYFAGLTDIKFPVWLLICSLGRIPSIITSTIGGDALGTEKYWFAAIVFAAALAVSGLGLLIYNRITREQNGGEKEKGGENNNG